MNKINVKRIFAGSLPLLSAALVAAVLTLSQVSVSYSADPLKPAEDAAAPSPTEDASLSPEELQELLAKARKARLKDERKQVAAEIKTILFLEDEEKDAIIKAMEDGASDALSDNITRFGKAFCQVDKDFKAGMAVISDAAALGEKYAKSNDAADLQAAVAKYKEAAELLAKIKKTQEGTYQSAVVCLAYADALAGANMKWEAIEAYNDVCQYMPHRISFSAMAAKKSADIYDQLGAGKYAMKMYVYCVKNYGLAFEMQEVNTMLDRAEALAKLYEDPMASVIDMMRKAGKYLNEAKSKTTSAKEAQDSQNEIVNLLTQAEKEQNQTMAMLTDMIRMAEQQQSKKPQPQPQPQQGQQEAKREDQKQGGKNSGQPDASKPRETGSLVDGVADRPPALAQTHSNDETGDWTNLSPQKAAEIEEVKKQIQSERYGDLIREYHRRLAKLGSTGGK